MQPLNCGVVADFLAVSIDRLGSLLVQLEQRGILRLLDIGALEGLAGRALSVPKQSFEFGADEQDQQKKAS